MSHHTRSPTVQLTWTYRGLANDILITIYWSVSDATLPRHCAQLNYLLDWSWTRWWGRLNHSNHTILSIFRRRPIIHTHKRRYGCGCLRNMEVTPDTSQSFWWAVILNSMHSQLLNLKSYALFYPMFFIDSKTYCPTFLLSVSLSEPRWQLFVELVDTSVVPFTHMD